MGRPPVAHWEDVAETIDELGGGKAALVGNSFGGAVALRVAAVHPEKVASLTLISAPAVPEPEPSPELLAVWDAVEGAEAAGDVEGPIAAIVAGWVRPAATPAVGPLIAAMHQANLRGRGGEQIEFAEDPLEADPDLLALVDCPAVVAAGAEDLPDFKDAVGALVARLPDAAGTTIPDCGHLAPLEVPAASVELILESLER
ncbi:MAG: alpha/beta hydrolase [Actinobacteria bacterium]|nr:alpha/beta hydrolase [Actinomycetota bacterium]